MKLLQRINLFIGKIKGGELLPAEETELGISRELEIIREEKKILLGMFEKKQKIIEEIKEESRVLKEKLMHEVRKQVEEVIEKAKEVIQAEAFKVKQPIQEKKINHFAGNGLEETNDLFNFVIKRKKYLESLAEAELTEERLLEIDKEYQQLEYIEGLKKTWHKTKI